MAVHMRTPGELVASLPALLGFVPLDSIVVVGVGGTGRVAPVIRVDRGDCLIPELARSVASAIVGHLARASATTAVLVSFGRPGGQLACPALDALRPLIEDFIEISDAWVVVDGRYRAPECPDRGCCPDAGRAVPSPPDRIPSYTSRSHLEHVRGSRTPQATADRRKRARAAFQRAWRGRDDARRAALPQWRRTKLDAWRLALAKAGEGVLPTDAEAGKIAAGLRDIVVRDAAVISMVPGRHDVANALCDDAAADGVREALAVMIAAQDAVQPRAAEVAALVTLAQHIASLCDEGAAPALTLAGLALWWAGDDSAADYAISCALGHEPGYRLAELVACALQAHMPPGWIAAA